ncbi:hypothetical protein OUZ56_002999 [Daphnia magna]|uniref:Uncharacterized protein n=1 Tax=Daphnia magna TaxID=35525 RepID=A0ABR0A7F0_9CRUS|nr:hypothetical protein OUZ56_002999 [Daphnia magna]
MGVAPVTKGPSMGVSRRRPKLKEEDGQTRDSGMDSLTSIVGGPGPAVKPAAITPTKNIFYFLNERCVGSLVV